MVVLDFSDRIRNGVGLLYGSDYYRPQRSWGKVMFLQASVILLTGGGGGLPQCILGYHPPGPDPHWKETPQDQAPPPKETP